MIGSWRYWANLGLSAKGDWYLPVSIFPQTVFVNLKINWRKQTIIEFIYKIYQNVSKILLFLYFLQTFTPKSISFSIQLNRKYCQKIIFKQFDKWNLHLCWMNQISWKLMFTDNKQRKLFRLYVFIQNEKVYRRLSTGYWPNGNLSFLIIYLSLPTTRLDLIQGQWPEGWLKVWFRGGEGQTWTDAWTLLDFAGHQAYLVQCGPDEPNWTWTQIWVQGCMPDYSLNWTARSSAIQGC